MMSADALKVVASARAVVTYNGPLAEALAIRAPMAWRPMLNDLSEALDDLAGALAEVDQ